MYMFISKYYSLDFKWKGVLMLIFDLKVGIGVYIVLFFEWV